MKRTHTHRQTVRQQQRATEGGVSVQGLARAGPSKQGADESDFWFTLKKCSETHTHTQEQHTLTVLLQVYYRAFYNNSNYFILIFTKLSPVLFDFICIFFSLNVNLKSVFPRRSRPRQFSLGTRRGDFSTGAAGLSALNECRNVFTRVINTGACACVFVQF